MDSYSLDMPAKAGIQLPSRQLKRSWAPACAGVTKELMMKARVING